MGIGSMLGGIGGAIFGGPAGYSLGSSLGGIFDGNAARNQAKDDFYMQSDLNREFAQNGIKWRVEDAKAAGIHPLAALGAQTISPSASINPTTPVDMSGLGQDISRAVNATRSQGERNDALLNSRLANAQVDNAELQNALLRSQIAKLNASTPPALPTDGMGASVFGTSDVLLPPPAELKSNSITRSDPGNNAKEAGAVTDYGFTKTARGGLAIVPSKDWKDRGEDQVLPELMWGARNLHVGNGPPVPSTRDYPLPKGYYWQWNPFIQEFRPVRGYSKFSDSIKRYVPRFLGGNN